MNHAWMIIEGSHSAFTYMTEETLSKLLKDWETYVVYVEGKPAAVVVTRNNEAHMACLPKYRGKWLTKKVYKDTVGKQIQKYGSSITSCFTGSPNADYIKRLGYQYKETIKGIDYYETTEPLIR